MSDTCYICGSENEHQLETHHIVPRRFGGSDADENLVDLCSSCHTALEKIYDSRFYEKLGVQKPIDALSASVINDKSQLKFDRLYVFKDERALYRYKGLADVSKLGSSSDNLPDVHTFRKVENKNATQNRKIESLDDIMLVEVDTELNSIEIAKRIERSDALFESITSL